MLSINNKKIVLTGPPDSGKTTIKTVFFHFGNPIMLLKDPMDPTRGINSSIFSIFDSELGIFDLAGQENKIWFTQEKEIFNKSNVIICIFDVRSSLESIISFLIDIIKIKKNFGLYECSIILFLHKIDLVNYSYVSHKITSINNFFETQYRSGLNFQIYRTSIVKNYFFETYKIILDILNLILQKNLIPISNKEFCDLEIEIKIVISYESSSYYLIEDLKYKFELNDDEVNYHLNRLKKLGFIERESNKFKLTKRSMLLKENIEFERNKIEVIRSDKRVELFYTFNKLTEKII